MAIALGNTSTGGGAVATSLTYSHTVASGSDRFLMVGIDVINVTDVVTGATYNGVAMTRANTRTDGITRTYTYYLFAPTTGANNVVISMSGTNQIAALSIDYNGVNQSAIDSQVTNGAATGSTGDLAFTTVADNCWTVALARTQAGGSTPTASTGSTFRVTCTAD